MSLTPSSLSRDISRCNCNCCKLKWNWGSAVEHQMRALPEPCQFRLCNTRVATPPKNKPQITGKMQVSGPWTATKHANKRLLCPRRSASCQCFKLYTGDCPKKKKGKLLQRERTWDRINLSSVPSIHEEQAFFHRLEPGNKMWNIWAGSPS